MRALRVTFLLLAVASAMPAAALATQARAARSTLSIATFVQRIFSTDRGYDRDGDGVLLKREGEFVRAESDGHVWDVTELANRATGHYDARRITRRQLRHWLRHWDRSHDGRLSRKEFVPACESVYGEGPSMMWTEHCRHMRYTSLEQRIF